MDGAERHTRDGQTRILLDKVRIVLSEINEAKHVDQVICALYSLAILLFPIDTSLFSGAINQQYRSQIVGVTRPSEQERRDWWELFYRGAAFPILANALLYDVASNWLACFPVSARKYVYDVFFLNGLPSEIIQTVVPCLNRSASDSLDNNAIRSNAERLLVLWLFENDGTVQMAREFSCSESRRFTPQQLNPVMSRVAQLVASVPDKAHSRSPISLSPHTFFKQITAQLLSGAEEWEIELLDNEAITHRSCISGTFRFIGETFARICRRGSTDVLLSELGPRIGRHVCNFLGARLDVPTADDFLSKPGSQFWSMLMETVMDLLAVERMSEQLLHQLATENAGDVDAYWILWLLFHRTLEHQTSVKSMFTNKFLLWKVFPLCCLRWILHVSVLQFPPDAALHIKKCSTRDLINTVQHLVTMWSKQEFIRSSPVEQQAYVTAALGLSLEKFSKEELDSTTNVMHLILQGVSSRLESPDHLVRRMASSIALVFSKIVDPSNPLYLDDSCKEEIIDWEFGFAKPSKVTGITMQTREKDNIKSVGKNSSVLTNEVGKNVKCRTSKLSEFKLIDPDEVVDPATLDSSAVSDEEDSNDASDDSDYASDSSLQPYDLSDDDTDLKKKFSQLVDVVGALRKTDNPDGVVNALDVAEKLVRASPSELRHVAGDLVGSLIRVRCSDVAIEGEEESAEEKRQGALIALLVTSPLQSLDTISKILYSPTVDTSQRILILDVMTEAAQELADTKTYKQKHQPRTLISTISENQAWFLPSNVGPLGASSWKERSNPESPLNWSYSYERDLPLRPGQVKRGKTLRWSMRSAHARNNQSEVFQNKFPLYAAAFMLPAMQGYDKKRHGVDLLGRDFIVLGKLIYMLGVCMKCASMHPEAAALAPYLLDMLSSRDICRHPEAYVRRSALFAASCVLLALHPSHIASALVQGNADLSRGLEWIRTWALQVAESDMDKECYTMAMACLQLHAEMALQASRALQSTETSFKGLSIGLPDNITKDTIKIPHSNVKY